MILVICCTLKAMIDYINHDTVIEHLARIKTDSFKQTKKLPTKIY